MGRDGLRRVVFAPGPGAAEFLAAGGVDYVVLDLQHGLVSEGDLPTLFPAIEAHGRRALVRLLANDPVAIGRVLDLGASGIVVPNVNSAEEAKEAVDATRFPPRGSRGFGPIRAALTLGPDALEDVAVIAQIESEAAVECVEEIALVDGDDCTVRRTVGSLGLSRQVGAAGLGRRGARRGDRPGSRRGRCGRASGGRPLDPCRRGRPTRRRRVAVVNVADDVTVLRDGVAAGLERVRPA